MAGLGRAEDSSAGTQVTPGDDSCSVACRKTKSPVRTFVSGRGFRELGVPFPVLPTPKRHFRVPVTAVASAAFDAACRMPPTSKKLPVWGLCCSWSHRREATTTAVSLAQGAGSSNVRPQVLDRSAHGFFSKKVSAGLSRGMNADGIARCCEFRPSSSDGADGQMHPFLLTLSNKNEARP